MSLIDAIRQISVNKQTYYRWKKKYGGMGTEQLKELKRLQKEADPPAIIFSADYWSYAIDDRSMQDRHPDLDTYLRQIFPFETCKGGYCIRRKVRELP